MSAPPIRGPLQDERFLLLERLGSGGSATVFSAFDRCAARAVALKVQRRATAAAGPGHPLAAEFDLWSRIGHRNVVRALELATASRGPLPRNAPYLVLELVRGDPADRAARRRRRAADWLERLATDALRALAHVHRRGVVHRDVKPANLLVEPDARGTPRVRLTDFGLAGLVGERTRAGRVSGSLPYVAPECLLGGPVDGRADLYGLGLSLYVAATGEHPCPRRDAASLLRWHLAGPSADPRCIRPRLPDGLSRLIVRLTERDAARRPASADEALERLGVAPDPEASGSRCGRADRARLRLALDAARLGARRRFDLLGTGAAALRQELRVWSLVRGIAHARIADSRTALGDAVGRLLCRRDDSAALVRRHELECVLPLRLVGGTAVADRGGPARAAAERLAACVAGLLLDLAARATLVVEAAATDPRSAGAAVLRQLARRLDPPAPAGSTGGGLLLAGPVPGLSRRRSATVRDSSSPGR